MVHEVRLAVWVRSHDGKALTRPKEQAWACGLGPGLGCCRLQALRMGSAGGVREMPGGLLQASAVSAGRHGARLSGTTTIHMYSRWHSGTALRNFSGDVLMWHCRVQIRRSQATDGSDCKCALM